MTIMGAINKTRKLLKQYKKYDIDDMPMISAQVSFNKHDSSGAFSTECRIYMTNIDESFEGSTFNHCFKKMIEYFNPPEITKEKNQSDKIK